MPTADAAAMMRVSADGVSDGRGAAASRRIAAAEPESVYRPNGGGRWLTTAGARSLWRP